MPTVALQFKRGLFNNLPGLRAGEPGFTTDSYDLYVGIDSTTTNNQLVGSGRFWSDGGATAGSGVNLVEATNNGTSFITLASPASLAGIVTYYFPGTQGGSSSVLTNDGSGNLTWGSGSADPIFTGIATFNTSLVDINSSTNISGFTTFSNTTDNILGNADTGAVQIDGGLGVNKNVTVGGNLNVNGDLYVLGTTSEVNTETLKVEDSLVEVGLVNSGGTLVPPVSDLNIDVGVLFHYHTGAAAKKAGLFWDDSVSRVVVGSDLTESSSVMTIATYASFEIGSLWVNDAAGQSEVIRYDGTQRVLENITIDCGTY